jgi:hypothetical protein
MNDRVFLAIDPKKVIGGFIKRRVAEIGSDPDGWDKKATASQHDTFMLVSNHELSIESLPRACRGGSVGE